MEEVTKESVIIHNIKQAIERDKNALEYQEEELKQLKVRVKDLEEELEHSKQVLSLEYEILKEYEGEQCQ